MLSIIQTESTCRFDITHPDKDTKGIAGIKESIWGKALREEGIKINSLGACEFVFNHLVDYYDGNKLKALKSYKGAINNMTTFNRTMDVYKRVKRIEQNYRGSMDVKHKH